MSSLVLRFAGSISPMGLIWILSFSCSLELEQKHTALQVQEGASTQRPAVRPKPNHLKRLNSVPGQYQYGRVETSELRQHLISKLRWAPGLVCRRRREATSSFSSMCRLEPGSTCAAEDLLHAGQGFWHEAMPPRVTRAAAVF